MMQGEAEKHPIYRKMVDLRLACDGEIRSQRQKASEAAAAFRRSLSVVRARSEENVADGEKLANIKAHLKKLEDDLRETLIVKNCNEAKHVATVESLTTAKVHTEELRKIVQEQRAKNDEYEAVIALGLERLNQDNCQETVDIEGIEDAILWYQKVLGFRIEGGEGVRFIFDKIDLEKPDKEYSFTIRLDGDTYTLLQSDPYVQDVKELLEELNQTNDLFKFARTMRVKFQAAALKGVSPATTAICLEPSTVTISSPPPVSADSRSDSSSYAPRDNLGRVSPRRRGSQTSNTAAPRRSPRFKVRQSLKS